MIVYRILNTKNLKSYIGKTHTTFKRRYAGGWWNKTHNEELKQDCLKYGRESFEIEILVECCTAEELSKQEEMFIRSLDTMYPNGYNHILDVNRSVFSEHTRMKMSLAHKGKKLTSEHKQKLSVSNVGKHFDQKGVPKSEEHKKKIKEAKLKYVFTPEHLYKVTVGKMGAKNHNAKAICQIDFTTGLVINNFTSIAEASRHLKLDPSNIRHAAIGTTNKCGGFKWKFKNEIT